MQNFPKSMILWLVGFSCLGFIVFYAYLNIEQDNQNQGIQETLQATLNANQDYSERTNEKLFYLDKNAFEIKFAEVLVKNKNFNSADQEIEFSYLPSEISNDSEAISAVKVKVLVNKKVYQGTVIIENGGEK